MKTMNWKRITALSCFLFVTEGAFLWAQPSASVSLEETEVTRQPAVPVELAQQMAAEASPASFGEADTLAFLSESSPLSKSEPALMEPASSPEVPHGWTRAASNPNFAFLRDFRCSFSGCWYFLSMLDLQTGAETMLSSEDHYFLSGASYKYDVSPDGKILIYSVATSSSWQGGPERNWGYTPVSETYIKDLNDPARSLRLNGDATKIQFTSGSEAVVTIDGIDVRIDLQTMRALDPRDLDPVHISTATDAYLTDFSRYQTTPVLIGGSGGGETAYNFRQLCSKQFAFDYDLTRSSVPWAAAMLLFNGEKFDATANDIVLEANVTGASYYKLELEDQNGLKTVFRVGMTNGRIQVTNAMIQAVGVAGFDAAHLRAVLLTVDDLNATTGTVVVNARGLVYVPEISTATPATLTDFTRYQVTPVAIGAGGQTVVSSRQASASQFAFDYDLSRSREHWAAAMLLFNGEKFDATANDIVLEANVTGASYYKLELEDQNGLKTVFRVGMTNGRIQVTNAMIQNAAVPGFDAAHLKTILLTVDGLQATTGSMTINARGLVYQPVITAVTTAPLTDFTRYQVTPVAVELVPGSTVQNLRPTGASEFAFNYNLQAGGTMGHWAAAMLLFNNERVFSAKKSDIVLNVAVTGASYYKLELEDQQGLKTVFCVTVTSGRIRITNSMIQSAAPVGFDADRLKAIVMVVDDPKAATGSVKVNTGGFVSRPLLKNYYRKFPFHSWQWWYWYSAR